MSNCHFCDNPIDPMLNYCSWDCHVEDATRHGCTLNTPNHLPVMCITGDGYLLEVEHGDHKDYKFPVEVEPTKEAMEQYPDEVSVELHALIYFNEYIALTLHEYSHYLFSLKDGACMYPYTDCKLSQSSIEKIRSSV